MNFIFVFFFKLLQKGLLIFIGVFATLASMASKVSISRDWIVALFGYDQQVLAGRIVVHLFFLS